MQFPRRKVPKSKEGSMCPDVISLTCTRRRSSEKMVRLPPLNPRARLPRLGASQHMSCVVTGVLTYLVSLIESGQRAEPDESIASPQPSDNLAGVSSGRRRTFCPASAADRR